MVHGGYQTSKMFIKIKKQCTVHLPLPSRELKYPHMCLKVMFLFPSWDMLVPWSLPFHMLTYGISSQKTCQKTGFWRARHSFQDFAATPSKEVQDFPVRNFNRNLNPLMASRHPGNKTPPKKGLLNKGSCWFQIIESTHFFQDCDWKVHVQHVDRILRIYSISPWNGVSSNVGISWVPTSL